MLIDLKCDESGMTGETDAVKKNPDKDPWMLCGCQILEGRGKMLVIAVGPNSQVSIFSDLLVSDIIF